MALVALLYALFASLFGLSKATLNYSEPFFLIGSRMSVAGIIMITLQLIKQPKEIKEAISINSLKLLIPLGIINIYLTNITEILALVKIQSSKACLLYSLSPFLSAIISYFFLAEKLTRKKTLGLLIGLCGLGTSMPDEIMEIVSSQNFSSIFSLGEMMILAAVVFSVCGWILLKKTVTSAHISIITANGVSMFIGGTLALLHSYYSGENWNPLPIKDINGFIINSILLLLISNLICYNLYGHLLKQYSATFMSFAGLITPLFASFFGWLFLNESITMSFVVSLALFSMGLFFFHQEETKKPLKKITLI
jgi:drug/metabolite transporter (DMT)-like permease